MKLTSSLALSAFLWAGSLFGATHAKTSSTKPNVVYIVIDDLDFDELNSYDPIKFPSPTGAWRMGYVTKDLSKALIMPDGVYTPTLDKMAKEGMRMDRFYETSSVCTPSRYTLLTGRYDSEAPQIMDADGPEKPETRHPLDVMFNIDISPTEWTIQKVFQQNGYRTGLVGKWHNTHFTEMGIKLDGLINADPKSPEVESTIKSWYATCVDYMKKHYNFDFVGSLYVENPGGLGLPASIVPTQDNLEWTTDAAVKFIDQSKHVPFFLYYAITAPHGTLRTDFLDKANPLGTADGLLDKVSDVMPPRASTLPRVQAQGIKDPKAAMGLWIDDAIAAVMEKVDDIGQKNNTIFVIISDQQTRGKFGLHEGNHVPALFYWPGHILAGHPNDSLMSNVDVPITLAELCHLKIPEDWKHDGLNFADSLLKGAPGPRKDLLLETGVARGVVTQSGWTYIALRMPKDKEPIIRYTGDIGVTPEDRAAYLKNPTGKSALYRNPYWFPHFFDPDQLYNLNADPYEQNNLANNPADAAKLAELKNRLSELLKKQPGSFAEFAP